MARVGIEYYNLVKLSIIVIQKLEKNEPKAGPKLGIEYCNLVKLSIIVIQNLEK